jgi:aryl-alcohol dehydrogenase-like predicted oxidoreductase
MEYAKVSHVGKKVSRIGMGTWAIGGWMWGGTDEKMAIAALHKGFSLGITLVDTAPVYGFGKSEEIVGKAVKEYGNREGVVIATKFGLSWDSGGISRNSSRKRILKEIEDSLRRLQVEYIDIYQVHWPDTSTSFEETASTLKELLDSGKIRAIGVSNFSPEQMNEFLKYAPIHTCQPPFNLFEREIEKDVLPYCIRKKIATLGYGSICRGLLSGKMDKQRRFHGDDLRKEDPKFQEPLFSSYLACVERLKEWAKKKHDRSLLSLAVRWVLDKGTSVALWGVRKPEQLDDVKDVWGWKLSSKDFQEIDQILAESLQATLGPEFMAPP